MDSRNPLNPYGQSPSLVGLLNSQNFPYESYQSGVHFGESQQADIPPFSSQETATPLASKDRKKWTPADDEVIISAWINTSKDSVVGNSQKLGTFWSRVGEYYAASPHAKQSGDRREHLNIKQRWHKINDFTNKFCAAYAAAERQISSGQSDHDVLKMAHKIYFADHKKKFTLEHAWCILRFEQKWLSLNTPKPTGSSKRKECDTPSQSTNTTAADDEVRPEGVKAAKAKRNTAKGKSVADYETIMEMKREDWEMKKDDLDRKERLSKLAILDTLLAKKEPLKEAEEVVKNNLLKLLY
ncbi:glutathione S-transferase T3-like [Brassica rapa]|nr:glutathione S-transferase T3-like [Brassica rapa]